MSNTAVFLILLFKQLATAIAISFFAQSVVAQSLSDLFQQDKEMHALADAGRFSDAITVGEDLLRKAVARVGANDQNVGSTHCFLGFLYNRENRFVEAESALKRCIELSGKFPATRNSVAPSLANLANTYKALGRTDQAEATMNQALVLFQRGGPDQQVSYAMLLCNLADLIEESGRFREAETLARRCVASLEEKLGRLHKELPRGLLVLAKALLAQDRLAEAEPVLRQSLEIAELESSRANPVLARSLDGMANLSKRLGRYPEAEGYYVRSLRIDESTFGPRHPFIGGTLNNLATIYSKTGRRSEALEAQIRALEIFEKTFGEGDPRLLTLLDNMGLDFVAQQSWQKAYDTLRRAAGIHATGTAVPPTNLKSTGERATGNRKSHSNLSIAAWGLAAQHPHRRADLAQETFESAQLGDEKAAGVALAQLAARFALGDAALARRVRQQQDLIRERTRLDAALIAAISVPPTVLGDRQISSVRRDIAATAAKLAGLTAEIERDFPAYRNLVSPKPLSLADTQGLLRPDEALVLYLARSTDETFVWVVTASDMKWIRAPIGYDALAQDVAALRCGLDASAWTDATCPKLIGTHYSRTDSAAEKPLPFDHARAHRLYSDILGKAGDLIKGRHLLLVPSGPLTLLPFQVLLTSPPGSEVDANVPWLIREHALTVLPSVAALQTLRQKARTSQAPEPFIGFGNPVLKGQPGCGAAAAPRACPSERADNVSTRPTISRATMRTGNPRGYFKDGQVDTAALSKLCPLPETASELICVARSLGAAENVVILGRDMTETRIKSLPLDRYRVVHFATHGLLASETATVSTADPEPALVLTPPQVASQLDDGLLTASEVAKLKLDADWVVLSACNTASGGSEDGEALSGLARSFFYAGARALLVSHWQVDSDAATIITSSTFAELRADPNIGRAEGLRRALLRLINDKTQSWARHPSVWAPFVVVGEGGAAPR